MRWGRLPALVAAGCVWAQAAAQAPYPVRPVRIVVTFLPGGTPDILTRALGTRLGEFLGQPIVIDNRPGAGGNIGTDIVAKSAPDGYTLVVAAASPFGVNPTLYGKQMTFDPVRDFAPVAFIARNPLLLVANPSLPARNLPELIALARAQPGRLRYGSAGNGTSNHLAAEMLKQAAGIDLQHIPFKGTGPGITSLIGGEIELVMAQVPSGLPSVRAGRVRALVVTSAKRSPVLPDVPTVGETLPGFEATSWYGIAAPAGTPGAVVARLNRDIVRALATPELRARLEAEGAAPEAGSPEEFAAFIRAEIPKWGQAVRASGAKLD